jgi:hypothetical protein
VVDNGSTDGTAAAVRAQFPQTQLIERLTNEGVWARSHAFAPAQGRYLVLLDDDSYPVGDAVARSIDYLEQHGTCAAVVGRVVLPDESLEACALPAVMLSGAVCLRKSAVDEVGSFAPEFFRKAGEYDFSFRLLEQGFTIERFENIVYRHDKVGTGRSAALAHRMDLRNNLILVERYLPEELRAIYRQDWAQRYGALARHEGHNGAVQQAMWEARLWRVREAFSGRRVLSAETLETVFQFDAQRRQVGDWCGSHGIKNVVIADFGKNLYATYAACQWANLQISAIADNHPAFAGLNYRGVPVLNDQAALESKPDGIVVANINPAQVEQVAARLSSISELPILTLWKSADVTPLRQAA